MYIIGGFAKRKNDLKKKLFSKTYKMTTIENSKILSSQEKASQKRIDPEQLKENNRKAKLKWIADNPAYYRKGGYGYQCMTRKIQCECGRTIQLKDKCKHKRTAIHAKRMKSLEQQNIELN